MIVGPITVRSACSHHMCPIFGKVWIGILPNEHSNLIGLSKYTRLCDWVMSRPQIQEEAVTRLADLLHDDLQQILAAAKFHVGFLDNRAGDDDGGCLFQLGSGTALTLDGCKVLRNRYRVLADPADALKTVDTLIRGE